MTYQDSLAKYDATVNQCIELSQELADIPSPTGKHNYASVLFTRLCTISVSLLILLPHSKWSTKKIEHWDYMSVASLTRNIIECYLTFFYLCIDKVSEIEWECRWKIMNLHDCTSRKKLFKGMGDKEEDLIDFMREIEKLKDSLSYNEYFSRLSENQRKKYLKGNDALLLTQDEILTRKGWNSETFRWIYNFLSAQTHTLPLSFYRMQDTERGRGVHSNVEEGYTKMCLELATDYLQEAASELKSLFEGVSRATEA